MPSLRPTWLISLLTLAGCAGSAYQGPPSDHFDGERFRNIQPTAHKSLRDLLSGSGTARRNARGSPCRRRQRRQG